jgi:hypothetical protein
VCGEGGRCRTSPVTSVVSRKHQDDGCRTRTNQQTELRRHYLLPCPPSFCRRCVCALELVVPNELSEAQFIMGIVTPRSLRPFCTAWQAGMRCDALQKDKKRITKGRPTARRTEPIEPPLRRGGGLDARRPRGDGRRTRHSPCLPHSLDPTLHLRHVRSTTGRPASFGTVALRKARRGTLAVKGVGCRGQEKDLESVTRNLVKCACMLGPRRRRTGSSALCRTLQVSLQDSDARTT